MKCAACGKKVDCTEHPDAKVYHMACLKAVIKTVEERKKENENEN